MDFSRYGIYFTPAPGPLADFGAAWLGWDLTTGQVPAPPDIPELASDRAEITQTPSKYGFHATIKPPFHLAADQTEAILLDAFETLCASLASVHIEKLELARLGRFLALVPDGDTTKLSKLAARAVRDLDHLRTPLTDDEIAKRRASGLSEEQDRLLLRWGYPHVMEAFRFHMTLTGKMPKAKAIPVKTALWPYLEAILPRPFKLDALSLVGESTNGRFHLIQRTHLTGSE